MGAGILSSQFRPDRLSNLVNWSDASNPNGDGTQLANGAKPSFLYDRSPRRIDATQASAGAQFTNVINALNGLPGLSLNGSSTYMSIPFASVFNNINTTGLTIFVVASTSIVTGFARLFGISSGANGWGFGRNAAKQLFTLYGVKDYTSANTADWVANTAAIMAITFSPSFSTTFFKNNVGQAAITGSSGALSTSGNLILGAGSASGEFWTGMFHESLIYTGVKPAAEIVSVFKGLGGKWGIAT